MASAGVGSAFRHLRDLFNAGSVVGLGDGALLARYARSKDEAAFEALVGRHGPMVLATCRAVLRNEQDVEDAFQATFLVLARKAGSIRGAGALGGWLHRVAYRASVQASIEARRRKKIEAEVPAMAPLDATRPGFETEMTPILHEEINRLPEAQRLPVVLCDLEGLTYEQAAERLQWTVPKLRCRLAKGRERLKGRLTARGLTTLAIGASLVPRGASAAVVPPALLRATVLAAARGSASTAATLLTHTLLKGMLMTKIKIASTASLVVLALGSAGLIAAGAWRGVDDSKTTEKPQPEAVAPASAPKGRKPVEMVEVKGRVLDPTGQPVGGAAVSAAYVDKDLDPFPRATSGPDGRFTIRLPKVDQKGMPPAYMARFPWLIGTAPGHGLGWTERVLRADRPDETVVTLTEEGPPLEGRIIDLEGRPVEGAKVDAARIWYEENGDFPGWIAKARNGAAATLGSGLQLLPLEKLVLIATRTGPDGRFRLTGVGRDRVAELHVSGPGIATTHVKVLSRDEKEIRGSYTGMMTPIPFVVHAPRFQVALAPSKRLEGVVRDLNSGRPIAGIAIAAAVFDESSYIPNEGVKATTDAQGRYVLDGLPKASAYRLFLSPGPGVPYTKATLKAPADSPGMEPATFDIALRMGILVRGKVTEKGTGRSVVGYASYFTLDEDNLVKDYQGFADSYDSQAYFQPDGSYELVALPGRGFLAVRGEDRHLPGVGADQIKGLKTQGPFFGVTPRMFHAGDFHVFKEVNIDPKVGSIEVNMEADPGGSVVIKVVDPAGQPIVGTEIKGFSPLFQTNTEEVSGSDFEVHALDPSKPRRIIVTHKRRRLIGSIFLRGTETGTLTVTLEPWAAVTGRILDDEGRPYQGLFLSRPGGSQVAHPETDDIFPGGSSNQGIQLGDTGRFRVEGLVPGLKYDASASKNQGTEGGVVFMGLILKSGETRDFGDVKLQPFPKQGD